jgi:hypothetical protein
VAGSTDPGAENTAELYVGGVWTPTGSMTNGRYSASAVLFTGAGQVLVTGGFNPITGDSLFSAELYNVIPPGEEGKSFIATNARAFQSIDFYRKLDRHWPHDHGTCSEYSAGLASKWTTSLDLGWLCDTTFWTNEHN